MSWRRPKWRTAPRKWREKPVWNVKFWKKPIAKNSEWVRFWASETVPQNHRNSSFCVTNPRTRERTNKILLKILSRSSAKASRSTPAAFRLKRLTEWKRWNTTWAARARFWAQCARLDCSSRTCRFWELSPRAKICPTAKPQNPAILSRRWTAKRLKSSTPTPKDDWY